MLRGSLYALAFMLALSALAYADLVLRWNDNSQVEDGYIVMRQAFNRNNFVEVARLPPNTTSWVDRSTRRNQRYCYLVVAYLDNERGFSNVACARDNGRAAVGSLAWSRAVRGEQFRLDVDK